MNKAADCEWCGGSGIVQSYGPFRGGDPRLYTPDPDDCTYEEKLAHAIACGEWDAGQGIDRPPQCGSMGDGRTYKSAGPQVGFGIGTNRWPCDHS